jgi:hypothetical protein
MVKFLLDNGAKLQRGTFDTERSYYGALTPEIQDILNNYKSSYAAPSLSCIVV